MIDPDGPNDPMHPMHPKDDAELETMLAELSDEERTLLLEDHRQLEKDLLRLADPLPPPDFVNRVMAKVAAAPPPAPSGSEVATAVLITFGAFAAGAAAFLSHGAGIGGLGLSFTSFVLQAREVFVAFGSTLAAVWHTAAVPVAAALAAMLVSSMVALKKVGTEAKVAS